MAEGRDCTACSGRGCEPEACAYSRELHLDAHLSQPIMQAGDELDGQCDQDQPSISRERYDQFALLQAPGWRG